MTARKPYRPHTAKKKVLRRGMKVPSQGYYAPSMCVTEKRTTNHLVTQHGGKHSYVCMSCAKNRVMRSYAHRYCKHEHDGLRTKPKWKAVKRL